MSTQTHKKPVIGLLGGIASGKSTAAREFEKLGCAVIDADKIAHHCLNQPEIIEKLIQVFGKNITHPDGKINRSELASRVFDNGDTVKKINEIIHPAVMKKVQTALTQMLIDTRFKAIVLDIPLLLEVDWQGKCDTLIFVDCDEQIRTQRAIKSRNIAEKQLKLREKCQFSLDKKKAQADNIIENNSEVSHLARQVAEVFSWVVRDE
jgi:dephospho-CoA kinase